MPADDKIRCRSCRYEISKLVLSCPICGARTPTAAQQAQYRKQADASKARRRLIYVILVIGFVASGVYIALDMTPQQAPPPDATKSIPQP